MRTAPRVTVGMDDSQRVELRGRGGMAMTVLTRQQCWIAPAMTSQAKIALRRMGRAKRNPSRSRAAIDGFRFALPILQIGHSRRASERANSDRPITFVFNAFQTQSGHRATSVSRFTCRAVPFRDQDAAIVQQPSP